MLFLIIAAAISVLIMLLSYTNWTWYTMAIIIDTAITLALEWESIVNDVRRLRSLNGLIIELRWLYHELQGIRA